LPIADTALAILRRGLRGLPVFRPDRKHIHHRLLEMGLSRRRVVLWLYAVTLLFLAMGFAAFVSHGKLIPVLLGAMALVMLLCAGKLSFSREWFAVGRVLGQSLAMRDEVQYALSITRWLALEGKRHCTVDSLWPDLVVVAQRLGFSSVRLTLADASRVWSDEQAAPAAFQSSQLLHGGRCGTLELTAAQLPEEPDNSDSGAQRPSILKGFPNGRTFEALSELVVEGWVKAIHNWSTSIEEPLRFDSNWQKPPAPLPGLGFQSPSVKDSLPETSA
jgi:hypothetical protein